MYLTNQLPTESQITLSLFQELRAHPLATLKDIYKFFFQGAFGPGHLIADPDSAWHYLQEELQRACQFDSLSCQAVGFQGRFYRLNLQLVKNGTIPLEIYFNAFVASATLIDEPSLVSWQKEWHHIVSVIKKLQLPCRISNSTKCR